MRRARLENRPRIPHTLKQLNKVLTMRRFRLLSKTMDGEDQLFAGRAGSASRKTLSLLFVTKRMLRYMGKRVRRIFCDATFSPVPRGMKASQVWTISTVRLHHVVPLVRVLMRKRTKATYTAVLEKLKELAPGFKPREVFADFEPGEQAALALAFPNATVHGCLFHYVKVVIFKSSSRLIQLFLYSQW
ncbi:uncharacterized protein LOC127751057 [Frankliniella occidentalis]|uniref:Uncharacterized protein LOC127751057 n=1 Tax=Frankliniella occidentalis TaxID=133901 RepID=A0A9C6XT16_FRAOC|nr:uncharacterized protein LOC127751057 [Frankliniella occidentalis]